MKGMKTPIEVQEKAVEMRKQGFTYEQIRKELNLAKNTVIKIMKAYDLSESKFETTEITEELLKIIQERYNEVGNIKIIAKEFHISAERLRRNGLKINKPIKKFNNNDNSYQYRTKTKLQAIKYKGGKCIICGYDECPQALDFHHVNPNEKDYVLSGGTKSLEHLKPELDKCVLLCCRCHREVHAGYKNLQNYL